MSPKPQTPTNAPGTTVSTVEPRSPAQIALANINERINRKNFLARLETVLPRHMTAEATIQAALHLLVSKPDLLNCTPESIAQSVFQVAMWGLELGRTAHIVAYGEIAQAQQDWKGMVERAIRAGAITSCRSRIVYEKDEIDIEYGLTEVLKHVPHWRQTDRGQKVGVYAVVTLPNGEQRFELLNREQVEHRRARSKAYTKGKSGPWVTDEDEMWRKTAVRLVLKGLPQSAEIVESDDDERLDALAQEQRAVAQGIAQQTRRTTPALRSGSYDNGDDAPSPSAQLTPGAVPAEVIDMKEKPKVEAPEYPPISDGTGGTRAMTDAERREYDLSMDRHIVQGEKVRATS